MMFCRHAWEKTHVETLESPLQRFVGADKTRDMKYHDSDLLMGTFICILTCKKCGAVDKTVEKV